MSCLLTVLFGNEALETARDVAADTVTRIGILERRIVQGAEAGLFSAACVSDADGGRKIHMP